MLKKYPNLSEMTTVNPTITSGSTNIRQGGSLTYTHNGPMMTAGSVSDDSSFYLLANSII